MTTHENYAWMQRAAAAWLKAEQQKTMKPHLALVTNSSPANPERSTKIGSSTDHAAKLDELKTILASATKPRHKRKQVVVNRTILDASPAQIAARISALNLAAHTVLTGDALADKRLVQEVCTELMETAAWLARKLANYHDDLDQQGQPA